ncbi:MULTISPECIES: response regulator transcription factor [Proteiniphilum]|uniref:response regulator transcription factor n=1 Tax=Proteiniphilum TaxID=294702 RepID=UPI00035E4F7B|nr:MULTISPECIES: response regulator transcription factor [Proteiniphilum]MDY9919288.1 response regulator transcription factor [Proteiniphilum sp.]SFK49771.1 DNA-binding response regulator, OmpR family, contains REC and winged-helix (wHTH) domain [Porphyromonadaceae bacterium KH3CP3RA]
MTDPIKVILVDDDTDLGNLVSTALAADGYKVHFQNSLAGINSIIEEFKPSILVLDVEIGEEDGITCAEDILKIYPSLPVLFISSHTDTKSVARGVRTGGVGYIRKPFDMEELKVFIDRFAHPGEDHSGIQIGRDYSLNVKTRELRYRATPVKQLSPHEFETLLFFVQNRDNVISYETLSGKVWRKEYSETEASMNNLVSRLRKILGNDPCIHIQTVKNRGYLLIIDL